MQETSAGTWSSPTCRSSPPSKLSSRMWPTPTTTATCGEAMGHMPASARAVQKVLQLPGPMGGGDFHPLHHAQGTKPDSNTSPARLRRIAGGHDDMRPRRRLPAAGTLERASLQQVQAGPGRLTDQIARHGAAPQRLRGGPANL